MTDKEKVEKLVKDVFEMELSHFREAGFCRQHNMKLDQIKHEEIARAIREIAFKIREAFREDS